jgi:hypothetical protein
MDFLLQTLPNQNNPYNNTVLNPVTGSFWGQGTNDFIVDNTGDFALVNGENNLAQSICKIIVTTRGDNTFLPMYGSIINSFVGSPINIDELRANIKTDLIDTLRIYQFINQGNPDPKEQIDILQSLAVNLIPGVNGITVTFQVITLAGTAVGSTITVEG